MASLTNRGRVAVLRTMPETFAEDLARGVRLVRARQRGTMPSSAVVELPVLSGVPAGVPGPTPWAVDALLDVVAREQPGSAPLLLGPSGSYGKAVTQVLSRRGVAPETPRDDAEIARDRLELAWLRGRRQGRIRHDSRLPGRFSWVLSRLYTSPTLGLRGAVEAAVAGVARPEEREVTALDPQAWADLLLLRRELFPRSLFVVDATVCLTDDGRERPVLLDLLVVGDDPVSCDEVAARLLGHDPRRLGWWSGVVHALGIESAPGPRLLVGEELVRAASMAPPRPRPSGMRRWERRLRRILRPVDPARWRQRAWARAYSASPWGRLDADYRDHGAAHALVRPDAESREHGDPR